MLSGVHFILYSKKPDADKAFFKEVLKLPDVDVGHGWLIFGLPPAELAVHPAAEKDACEMYLMCDNIKTLVRQMSKHKIACSEIQTQRWGLLVQLTLPGGGQLGVYQPRHPSPKPMKVKRVVSRAKKKVRKAR